MELINYFYIPIAKDCAITGTIEAQERRATISKAGYKRCTANLPTCPDDDTGCKETQTYFN